MSEQESVEDAEDEDVEYVSYPRADEVIPTMGSDAQKRPAIRVGTEDFEFSVTGAEGETVADVEDVFAQQLPAVLDAVDATDDDDKTYQ